MMVNVAAEGATDLVVASRLLRHVGLELSLPVDCRGAANLDARIAAYVEAARHQPWFILRDLDTEECAPSLVSRLVPRIPEMLVFRIAVRMIEAWLLADRENIAAFLHVRSTQVPPLPDELPNPKQAMVNLARSSRRKSIQKAMVPKQGHSGMIGREYASFLQEFARSQWDIARASEGSSSLQRACAALGRLAVRPA
jgi:hypothetical protein